LVSGEPQGGSTAGVYLISEAICRGREEELSCPEKSEGDQGRKVGGNQRKNEARAPEQKKLGLSPDGEKFPLVLLAEGEGGGDWNVLREGRALRV